MTLQELNKGGVINAVEKALIKALIIRDDELTVHLLTRHHKGDENAVPAIKEMIREMQASKK